MYLKDLKDENSYPASKALQVSVILNEAICTEKHDV